LFAYAQFRSARRRNSSWPTALCRQTPRRAQVYDRNLGQLGQWHPSLDWAVADYNFKNWFGIRAGKVKTTMGWCNDLARLRAFAEEHLSPPIRRHSFAPSHS